MYGLPLEIQGYVLGALSVLFALMDTFYGALIARTNSLTSLTAFTVDEYHNICDNVCDFQRRLLFVWLSSKLAQLFLAGVAVADIQLKQPNLILQWGGYLFFVITMYLFAYMINTYIAREVEIFAIHKTAHVRENELRRKRERIQQKRT
jgi:hypothetical protein